MRNLGPRVYVKRDEESSIGRGCILHGAHFRPEIAKIVWAACRAAPLHTASITLTEGARDIRDTRDMHEELRALDLTFLMPGKRSPTVEEYEHLQSGMKSLLGHDYDVIAHGDGPNIHIHTELDPK